MRGLFILLIFFSGEPSHGDQPDNSESLVAKIFKSGFNTETEEILKTYGEKKLADLSDSLSERMLAGQPIDNPIVEGLEKFQPKSTKSVALFRLLETKLITKGLSSSDAVTRGNSVRALATLNSRNSLIPVLRGLSKETDPAIRRNFENAFYLLVPRIGSPEETKLIAKWLEESPPQKSSFYRVIGSLSTVRTDYLKSTPEIFTHLSKLADEFSLDQQNDFFRLSVKIGSAEAEQYLLETSRNKKYRSSVRWKALHELYNLKPSSYGAEFRRFILDENEEEFYRNAALKTYLGNESADGLQDILLNRNSPLALRESLLKHIIGIPEKYKTGWIDTLTQVYENPIEETALRRLAAAGLPRLDGKWEEELLKKAENRSLSVPTRSAALVPFANKTEKLDSLQLNRLMHLAFETPPDAKESNRIRLSEIKRFVPSTTGEKTEENLPNTQVPHDEVRSWARISLENARNLLSPEEQAELDKAIRKKMGISSAPIPESAACEALCEVMNKVEEWTADQFTQNHDMKRPGNSNAKWEFTMKALALYSIRQAKPYCPSLQNTWNTYSKTWFDGINAPKVKPKPALSLRSFAKNLKEKTSEEDFRNIDQFLSRISDTEAGEGLDVYGKLFSKLLLESMILDSSNAELRKKLEEKHLKVAASLQHILADYQNAESGAEGSLLNTYALSVASLAQNDPQLESVKWMFYAYRKAENKLAFPYSPNDWNFWEAMENAEPAGTKVVNATERGSAARNVPFYLGLYKHAPKENREAIAANLYEALQNYVKHLPALSSNALRSATHLGSDGLAPYYFYSTVPYATSALKVLKEVGYKEADLSPLRNAIGNTLLAMRKKDGLFEIQGKDTYASSEAYVNPLAALALVPLINKCEGRLKNPGLGILSTSKFEKLTTTQPTQTQVKSRPAPTHKNNGRRWRRWR